MTWRKPKRNNGDERIRTRFAWLPVMCWEGNVMVTKWLEKVTTRQRYVEWSKSSFWCDEQFIEKSNQNTTTK